jgi:hypothetical protein
MKRWMEKPCSNKAILFRLRAVEVQPTKSQGPREEEVHPTKSQEPRVEEVQPIKSQEPRAEEEEVQPPKARTPQNTSPVGLRRTLTRVLPVLPLLKHSEKISSRRHSKSWRLNAWRSSSASRTGKLNRPVRPVWLAKMENRRKRCSTPAHHSLK